MSWKNYIFVVFVKNLTVGFLDFFISLNKKIFRALDFLEKYQV